MSAFIASSLYPDPNTGQPANLGVGHLPTWKTNLRKCQRIGIRDRTGDRGGMRGNGLVSSEPRVWGKLERDYPLLSSETQMEGGRGGDF